MSYVGSHVWKLRQKVGNMRIITTTVDVLPINSEGQVKLVYAPHVNGWSCIGGHVEEGDSWASAACHELLEEGGITAKESELIPFAAISGPQRIFKYQDGETQPFTLCFYVKTWQAEGEQTDTEEVTQNDWYNIEDALAMKLTPWAKRILQGYLDYQQTGQFQMIEDLRA